MNNKNFLGGRLESLKAKVIKLRDGWQVTSKSTDSLDCLPSKWSESRSALPTDSHTSPPPPPTSGGSDELKPNTADLRVDHHLRRPDIVINCGPVSAGMRRRAALVQCVVFIRRRASCNMLQCVGVDEEACSSGVVYRCVSGGVQHAAVCRCG